jgi:RNA polymerase primary sigma factor
MKAVDRYDPERGTFSNHAVYWIRQAISRALVDQGRTIRVPVYIRTLLGRMTRLSARLFEEQGYEPTPVQLAEAMSLSVEQVQFLTGIDQLPVSLDQHISAHDERTTLADIIPDTASPTPNEALLSDVQRCELPCEMMHALASLTEREQRAIILRFGLDGRGERSLREAGEEMGISRERVRQLEEAALVKLRTSQSAPMLALYLREPVGA